MPLIQLRLDLWQELTEAERAPEHSDLPRLCQGLEEVIAATPPAQKLQAAATAFLQIAGIFALRAEVLLTDWEQTHSDDGPVMEEDDLTELLRQSMALELDELIAEPVPYTRQRQSTSSTAGESIACLVDKAALLEAFNSEIEAVEAEAQWEAGALSGAHDEDVVGWSGAIAHWLEMRQSSEPVSLIQLQQALGMSLVEIWMGLLLSQEPQFQLGHTEEFYDLQGIRVQISYTGA